MRIPFRALTLALAAIAGLSAVVPAGAQGVDIIIGGGRGEGVQYRDFDGPRGGRDFDGRRDRDFDRRGPGRDRDFDRRDRGCSPRLALRKAFDIGANRPRIARENRRIVAVDGLRRGRPITVIFANDRGCPVLDVRR